MSYCRTNESDSDVSVYKNQSHTYEIHVANGKRGPRTLLYRLLPKSFHWWLPERLARYITFREFSRPPKPTGFGFDGQSYYFESVRSCIASLAYLRFAGYAVPQRAFDRLFTDMEEEEA